MKRLFLLFALLLSLDCVATIRRVPQDYASIQSAINASQNGDTVLVASGRYFENIIFRGKNITVASAFLTSGNRDFINTTIIDGSQALNSDSASCVRIINGETNNAKLIGFTLTGGRGTRWQDEHGAGIYREGGAILTAFSSPLIAYNIMVDNQAINEAGLSGCGGGAIRAGDGSPKIYNNLISRNKGMYGGGIVLNYCSGAEIKNNVIAQNRVDQFTPSPSYGGGAIWLNNRLSNNASPNIIENNTIVGNSSFGTVSSYSNGTGGALVAIFGARITFRNNLVWGNSQAAGGQLNTSGAALFEATYNLVEGGLSGVGNISQNPLFANNSYFLSAASPAIDAGDTASALNDLPNPSAPSQAQFPSQGALRNDIGAYGGQRASLLPMLSQAGIYGQKSANFGLLRLNQTRALGIQIENFGDTRLNITSAQLQNNSNSQLAFQRYVVGLPSAQRDSFIVVWSPRQEYELTDTLLIFHDAVSEPNPFKVALKGSSLPTAILFLNTAEHNFGTIDVNIPQRDSAFYVYNTGTGDDSLYCSLNYGAITNPNALSVSPTSLKVSGGDSAMITFRFFPPLVNRTALNIYTPRVIVESRFAQGARRFEKTMRFRLTGSLAFEQHSTPKQFDLLQNYPNPFNPTTVITYQLPVPSKVTLELFDVLGRKVATLVDARQNSGSYSYRLNASTFNLSSGVYFYRLRANEFSFSKAMMLVR